MARTAALLPGEFGDLEPFAADWVLPTEHDRYAKRLASSMETMQAFYDATAPRAPAAIEYLNGFELNDLPTQARNLMLLIYSLIMVSWPIEVWKQPHVPDGGPAYMSLVMDPVP